MIKPIQTRSTNVNVLDEARLEQVVGGNGHRGGHRRRDYNHCYENRRYNDCYNYEGGYESKGCDDSYESNDCHEESYDHCERKYS